jgi:hypothetical protein
MCTVSSLPKDLVRRCKTYLPLKRPVWAVAEIRESSEPAAAFSRSGSPKALVKDDCCDDNESLAMLWSFEMIALRCLEAMCLRGRRKSSFRRQTMQAPPAETPGSNHTPLSDELAPVVCCRKLRRFAVIGIRESRLDVIIGGRGRKVTG